MHIGVNDVGRIVAEMTRGLEGRNGALTAMEASRSQFEHWWKGGAVPGVHGSTMEQVTPGRRPTIEAGVDVGMESTWLVADGRSKYARDKKAAGARSRQNRVDLVVRAAPAGGRFHLIELKLFDRTKPGWPLEDQVSAIRKDMLGLQALRWDSTASAWSVVLGLRFDSDETFFGGVKGAGRGLDGVGDVERYSLTESLSLAATRVL